MSYPDNPEVVSSYSFQLYGPRNFLQMADSDINASLHLVILSNLWLKLTSYELIRSSENKTLFHFEIEFLFQSWSEMWSGVYVIKLFTVVSYEFLEWGSVTHQMAVPGPSISCCVLSHHNVFYQTQNALAFNWDTCCHLALCLQLLPFHKLKKAFSA